VDVKQIKKNIRTLLDEREWSLYKLAAEMKGEQESNLPWLSRLMHNKIKTPSLERLHSIANALNVSIEKIAGEGYEKVY
jgi:transcriptional regulator with XRE-family HTH domain